MGRNIPLKGGSAIPYITDHFVTCHKPTSIEGNGSHLVLTYSWWTKRCNHVKTMHPPLAMSIDSQISENTYPNSKPTSARHIYYDKHLYITPDTWISPHGLILEPIAWNPSGGYLRWDKISLLSGDLQSPTSIIDPLATYCKPTTIQEYVAHLILASPWVAK